MLVQLRPLVDTPKNTVYLMENDSDNAKEGFSEQPFFYSVKNIKKKHYKRKWASESFHYSSSWWNHQYQLKNFGVYVNWRCEGGIAHTHLVKNNMSYQSVANKISNTILHTLATLAIFCYVLLGKLPAFSYVTHKYLSTSI